MDYSGGQIHIQILISLIALISLLMPTILDILNYIIFKENVESGGILAHRNMVPIISGIKSSITRGILEIIFLPNKIYITTTSIIKALYRMYISKQNILEWVTSEEAENQGKTDIKSYYKYMWFNWVMGIVFVVGVAWHAIRAA